MIHPLGNRLLVKKVTVKETKVEMAGSGVMLDIPNTNERPTHKAEVVELGPEVDVDLIPAHALVLVTAFCGDEVEHDRELFHIINAEDVLAVIDR